jgi:hypothetical protein
VCVISWLHPDLMLKASFTYNHTRPIDRPTDQHTCTQALTPHNDPAFLESRRQGLEDYLGRLCRFPHLDRHPDLLQFLGFGAGGTGAGAGAGAGAAVARVGAEEQQQGSGAPAPAGAGGRGGGQQQHQVVVDL